MAKIILRFQDRIKDLQKQSQTIDQLRAVLDALSQKLQAEINYCYAEILAEYGPMHVTDLLEKALERGIPVKKGKRPQTILIRDALTKSKRFVAFGDNYWGIVGQQPPVSSNGHKVEQPQLTQF